MDVLEGAEDPELVLDDGAAQSADVVLAGEGLLGIGSGIVDRKTRVKRGGTLVEGFVAVPVVGAVLRGDDHRSSGGAAGVRIFLRGGDGKLLDRFRRIVLQETADPVIGVVGAVNG